jgi:hypothetical protein
MYSKKGVVMSEPISYPFAAVINGHEISEVQIGRHYLERHSSYMSDLLILELIKFLDKDYFEPDSQTKGNFYYRSHVLYFNRLYRIIWFLVRWREK